MMKLELPTNEKIPPHVSQDISPTVKNYLEKKGFKDEVAEVRLYQGVRINSDPTGENKILITANLNGCTATIIWTELADHTRSAQLVHFPPFMLEEHLQKITTLLTESDRRAPQKHALLYLSSKYRGNESKITEYIKGLLGESLLVTSRFYENRTDTESGIIGIELRPTGGGSVIYHMGKDAIAVD